MSRSNMHEEQIRIGVRGKRSCGSKSIVKALLFSGLLLSAGTLGGCRDAGEGLVTGAALGALTGMAIGSLDGNAGQGAAWGAAIGGVSGAIIGDENRRESEYGYSDSRYSDSYEYRSGHRGNRNGYPYCNTHRTYHSHHSRGYGHHGHYEYDEWWND